MADTIRTKAAILALLADNASQDISPQDLRDAIVSIFGVYGFLYVTNGSTAQTGIGTSPALMTGLITAGAGGGTTPNGTSKRIVIDSGSDGVYGFLFFCSFAGSNNATFTFNVRKNGSTELPVGLNRKLSAAGDVGVGMCGGIVTGLVATDWLDVYVNADGASKSMTPSEAGLIVARFF